MKTRCSSQTASTRETAKHPRYDRLTETKREGDDDDVDDDDDHDDDDDDDDDGGVETAV